jgi:isopenicillin N synthase-like dioxygenase
MTSHTLPIVDISAYLESEPNEEKKRETALHLRKVCSEIGFFYLVGHNIPSKIINGAHIEARKFFDLPQHVKDEISIRNSSHFRGYQSLGENVTKNKRDWHEAIDLYKEMPEDGRPLHGYNQWPKQPETFKPFFEHYEKEMVKLGNAVMRAIAVSLELDEHYFDKYIDNAFTYMRVINYPPLDAEVLTKEENIGDSCGVHCDYGCMYVNLHQFD